MGLMQPRSPAIASFVLRASCIVEINFALTHLPHNLQAMLALSQQSSWCQHAPAMMKCLPKWQTCSSSSGSRLLHSRYRMASQRRSHSCWHTSGLCVSAIWRETVKISASAAIAAAAVEHIPVPSFVTICVGDPMCLCCHRWWLPHSFSGWRVSAREPCSQLPGGVGSWRQHKGG